MSNEDIIETSARIEEELLSDFYHHDRVCSEEFEKVHEHEFMKDELFNVVTSYEGIVNEAFIRHRERLMKHAQQQFMMSGHNYIILTAEVVYIQYDKKELRKDEEIINVEPGVTYKCILSPVSKEGEEQHLYGVGYYYFGSEIKIELGRCYRIYGMLMGRFCKSEDGSLRPYTYIWIDYMEDILCIAGTEIDKEKSVEKRTYKRDFTRELFSEFKETPRGRRVQISDD